MSQSTQLPVDFLQHLGELEKAYLRESDPIRQSGFSGGPERWRLERSCILQAIPTGGSLLDVGCANGYLLQSLMEWGSAERGLTLEPYGVDHSEALISLARSRMPQYRDHFFAANAWGWEPPRRFDYVYCVYDCVPVSFLGAFVEHIRSRMTLPGGRLILGAYGSRSRALVAAPIDEMLAAYGYVVAGATGAAAPDTARFAWIDA